MLRSKKLWMTLTVAVLAMGCLWMTPSKATGASGSKGVSCVVDVVVETTGQTGAKSTTSYHKEFTLLDGELFSDDFSSATRFRFFDASLTRLNGEWTLSADWDADTSVFNTVVVRTAAIIPNGQKIGKTAGVHDFYTSNQHVQTSWTIAMVEN